MAKKKKKKVDAPLSEKEKRKQKIQEYNDKVAKMNGEKTSKEKAKEKKENNILSAFDDGYNFGDVTRTINKAFEKGVDKAYEMADEFKKDKNKTSEKVKYLGEGLKTGTVNAATNFVDAPLQNIQEGAQKSKNKSGLRNYGEATLKNLDPTGLSTFLDPQYASEVYQLWNDSKKSVTDKILGTGMKILNNNPLTRGLEATGQSANTFRDAEEDVKNIRKAIRKPSEKLNKEYEKEGQKFTQGMREIGEVSQNIGQQVPTAALSILTKNPDIGLYAMGTSAKGGSTYEAEQRGADLSTANDIGLAKGLTEIGTEKISSLGSKWYGQGKGDDLLESVIDNKVKGKVANYLTKKAAGVGGEILEEGISDVVDTAIDKATVDPDAKYTVKDFLHTAKITALSTIGMNAVTGNYSKKAYQKNALDMAESQRSENAQKVFEKELSDRLMEESDNGKNKLKGKDIIKITQEVAEDVANGQIDVSKIESALGGDTYKQYQDLQNKKSSLLKEQETLRNKSMNEATLGDSERLKQIESEISGLDDTELKERLSNEVRELTKDDNLLAKSYEEKDNRSKEFIYEGTDKDTDITKATIESTKGKLNNTKKAHNLVDALIKMGNDKGVTYKVTNNEELKKMGLVQDGKTTNGVYVGKNGEIYVNLDSKNYLEQIIMHETTHVLEKAKVYKDLQNLAFEFAKKNGTYETLEKEIQKNYDNKDWDSELTARIVEDNLGNEDFVTELTHQKPAIVQKIIDTIKYLKKQFTAGSSEARKLNKIQYQLEQAYKKAYNEKSDTNTNKNFSKEEKKIQGLEYYTRDDIKDITRQYIKEKLEENGYYADDIDIKGIDIHGSRNRGTAKPDSDLDVVFQYDGDIREDDLFNILNDNDDENLFINGIEVDINPITDDLTEYMKDSEEYDKEILNKINNKKQKNTSFSLTKDSNGKELTKEQQEYFKDSKVRDENGNLMPVYHASRGHQFTVFDKNKGYNIDAFYFTKDSNVASHWSKNGEYVVSDESYNSIKNQINNAKNYQELIDIVNSNNFGYKLSIENGRIEQVYDGGAETSSPMVSFDKLKQDVEYNLMSQKYSGDIYKEYLNITNPLVVDAKNQPYHNVEFEGRKLNTETIASIAKERGYDGVIVKNVYETDYENRLTDDYIAFESNQIKNIDNLTPTQNDDIRYSINEELDNSSFSLTEDSNGIKLTKQQQKYFKDSKVRDEKGRLLEVYHGTPNSDFNEFKKGGGEHGNGFYFTEDESYAEEFSDNDEGRLIKSYLKIDNPLSKDVDKNSSSMKKFVNEVSSKWDIPKEEILDIFNPYNEEWSSDLSSKVAEKMGYGIEDVENIVGFEVGDPEEFGITDYNAYLGSYAWDNGLNELARECGFDGIISRIYNSDANGYEYVAFNSNQIKEVNNTNPTDNPDIRYSLTEDNQGRKLSKQQQEYFKGSKAVDKNGNLKVLYNGGGDYTTFDNTKMSDQSKWGKGIYLTENSEIANMYGDNVKEVYADIKNPINQNEKTISFDKYNKLIQELYDEEADRYDYDMYDNDLDLLWDATNKGSWADYGEQLRNIVGVDGLIIDDDNPAERMMIAFNSNQVKNIDNTNPTEDPDIRYSKTVEEANTGKSDNGVKLTKEQKKYFKNSKATDENGNLITVYHTTTNAIPQFNEFNPTGTDYYKFGDQIVNYFTDSKEMSGSYADQDYVMADTSKITDKKGVNDILVETNNKLNGDRIFVIETNDNGTYFLYDKLHKNNHLMTKFYKSQEELFKNIKQDLQKRAGFREKTQYEGYVNITNPYVIDAGGENWDSVSNTIPKKVMDEVNEITKNKELKQALTDLANKSVYNHNELYSQQDQEKYDDYRYKTKLIKDSELRDAVETCAMFQFEYDDYASKFDYLPKGSEGINEQLKSVPFGKDETINDFVREYGQLYKDNMEYGTPESYFKQNYKNILGKEVENLNSQELFNIAFQDFREEFYEQELAQNSSTNDIVKEVIEMNKNGANYDGVIMKNVIDYGGESETRAPHDLYVTFNSNQFKNIDNTTPTDDPDIRYSLTEDNQGRKLSKGQQNFVKDNAKELFDNEGRVKTYYHTTTNEVEPFSVFNPVGTPGYKYGDIVVNFYTDNPVMSGSYADSDYAPYNYDSTEKAKYQYKGYIRMKNPYVIDSENRTYGKANLKANKSASKVLNILNNLSDETINELAQIKQEAREKQYNQEKLANQIKYLREGFDKQQQVAIQIGEILDATEKYKLNKEAQERNNRLIQTILEREGFTNEWDLDNLKYEYYQNDLGIDLSRYGLNKEKITLKDFLELENKIQAENKFTYEFFDDMLEDHRDNKQIAEILDTTFDVKRETGIISDTTGNKQYGRVSDLVYDAIDYDGKLNKKYLTKEGLSEHYVVDGFINQNTNDVIREVLEMNKNGSNYDGVIFKNLYDYGGATFGLDSEAGDVVVTFNSNQFKDYRNLNPTSNEDIRYSKGDNIAPVKKKGTLGSEVKLENGKVNLDNIAPVKGEVKYSAKEDKNSAKKTIKPSRKARKSYVSEKVEKAIINQAYKNMNVTTKTAQNYLKFTSEQKKEFKNSLIDLTTKMKDELTNAKTYNKVKDIVNNYANVEYNYVDEELKSIKKEIRGTKIKVPDEVKAQITDYSDFRKASRLNINSQGQSIDSVYQELSQEYPYLFSEDVQTEADMLYELSDFMYKDEKTTEKYRIPDNELKRATDKIYNSILNNSLTQAEIEEMQRDLDAKAERRTRQVVQHELLNKMGISIEDIDTGKDVSSAKVQLLDPKRLNEDVFSKEAAQKINDATVNFVNEQEAKNNRWKKKERQEIKDLGIKARSKESAAVQKYGEKEYINNKGELVKYGDAELEREFSNPKTREKIKNAAKVLRDKYDNYIDEINNSLTEMGYDPIPKRKDYFRHFYEINDKLSEWGIPFNRDSMNSDTLPTDINGLTDQFKPGKNFFASALQRTGKKTTYDAITGIDGYLESAGNLIYHTESIQRYRTLSKFIRDNYGAQHGMENLDGLTDEQIEKRISDIQNNKLSKYVAWLDEQANALAGKKGAIDRSVERFFGRKVYSALNTLKSQIGSNMTGFNVRSAMTNLASAVQGASKTNKLAFLKGTISTLNNIVHDDGLSDKSNFLTNRFGSDTLSKKTWQKVANAGQIFMTGSDYFTANQIWRSKYYENLSKGMNENQAIKNADDFAARIMGDRSKGQTAEIFNSKTLGFLTQFQLEVNNQWNSILHDNKIDLKNKNKSGAMVTFQLGQLFAASYLFNNLMKSLTGSDVMFDPIDILKGIFKPDDKDKDKTLEERSRDALGKLVNQLPMASIFTGGRIPLSEAFKGVSTGFKYATNQDNKYGQKYSLEDVKDDMIGSAAYWLLPTGYGQLRKTTKGLSMFDDKLPVKGSYTKSGNLRFSVDDTASERVKASLFGQYATKHAQDYIDSGFESINKSKLDEMKDLKMNSTDYKKLKKGINESGTSSEDKLNYIKDLDISNKKKNILASGVMKKDIDMKEYSKYDSLNEYKYAKENPSKYQTIRAITTYDNYKQIQKDLSEIKADVDRNGKTISNSRFKKVVNYVNSLKLTAVQKAMLIKQEYPSFKQYDNKIAQYINKQNYDFRQKATILKGLGFSNYDKQIINYVKEHYQSTDEQVQVLKDMGFKTYEYNGKIYIKR